MKQSNMKINVYNTRKGMVLPIILLVILLLVGAGIGGYWLVDNYVLFPDADDNALEAVLEHKFDLGFEYESSEDQGKVDISMKITDQSLRNYIISVAPSMSEEDINLALEQLKEDMPFPIGEDIIGGSISYKPNEFMADISLLGEEVHLISAIDDLVVGINGKNFGVSLKNFTDDFANSLFAPNSGSSLALPQETYDMIVDLYDSYMEARDIESFEKDVEILEDMILDCFKNSELGKCEIKYFGNKFNGADHAGRSQNFVFNRDGVISFLEVLSERLNNLSDEESAAFDRVIGFAGMMNDSALNKSSLIETINASVEEMKAEEVTSENRIELTVIYVAKNVAAIEINAYSKEMDAEEEHELYMGVDFGNDPLKNGKSEIIIQTFNDYLPVDVKIETNKIVEDGKTSLSIVVTSSNYEYDFDEESDSLKSEKVGEEHVYIDVVADKNSGLLTLNLANSDANSTEKTELMEIALYYSDSKDNLSFSFKHIKQDGVVVALPYDITVGFCNTADEIVVPEYDNILDYTEVQFEEFALDLMEYLESLMVGYGGTSPAPQK